MLTPLSPRGPAAVETDRLYDLPVRLFAAIRMSFPIASRLVTSSGGLLVQRRQAVGILRTHAGPVARPLDESGGASNAVILERLERLGGRSRGCVRLGSETAISLVVRSALRVYHLPAKWRIFGSGGPHLLLICPGPLAT
jgi:hypothetical protein